MLFLEILITSNIPWGGNRSNLSFWEPPIFLQCKEEKINAWTNTLDMLLMCQNVGREHP